MLPPTPTVPKGPPGVTLSEILADKSKDSGAVDTIEPAMKQTEQGSVFVGEGLPPLSPKLVLSIEKGEFVPLADLLPKTPSYEDQSVTEVADNVVVVTQLKQVKKKKSSKTLKPGWRHSAHLLQSGGRSTRKPSLTCWHMLPLL